MRDATTRQVKMIGCAGHTHLVVRENRFLRWRCKHHQCPDAMEARRRGLHCYHVHDVVTGEEWTEYEDAEGRRAA